jgi:hypothetical protein
VCSDAGAVCILDDVDGNQKLHLVKNVGFGVSSIAADSESGSIWLGGRDRRLQRYSLEELRSSIVRKPASPNPQEREAHTPKVKKPAIISTGFLVTHMITVDSTRAIRVCPIDGLAEGDVQSLAEVSMPAHRDAVLGLGALKFPNVHDANFFTWSCGGTVSFWDLQGKCHATMKIDLEQLPNNDDDANELRILRATDDMKMFVSGDRYGIVRFAVISLPV